MSTGLDAELCPASGVYPLSDWQNSVQRQGYVQCPSGRTLFIVRGMSIGLEEEPCPVSGVCPGSGLQNSFQLQGYIQWPGGRFCSSLEGYVLWPGGRTLSCVRCMSFGLEAELSESQECPESEWQNSVHCQEGISSVRMAELFPASGYVQMPGGRTLLSVKGITSGLDAEILPSVRGMAFVQVAVLGLASGVCPRGKILSCVRGMSTGLEAELCPFPVVCSVAWRQNSVLRHRYVQCPSGRMSYLKDENKRLFSK
ncbi:hypothetical protein TNCV_2147871 [Trichonephila clavipes]|uniref:Uncharacterized protein n=1 Tax=Trichonephila clavipes TaxID=2585209 RepID=A0A8X6VS29_TRICX|nr:hypothetical protein TNCV_2147871 [Trichonephila clavipes]